MKKILMLFAAIFLSRLTVFGFNDNVGETIGYVKNIHGDVVHVVGEPLTQSGYESVLVHIGGAPVYDLVSGFRVLPESIMRDMDIRVAYTTETDPFSAVVVWLNWDDDDAAVFTVTVSDNINYSQDDMIFLSADGKYRVSISPETTIIDPYYGLLSPDDIVPGMEFFVWVDILTASTPALVYPDKVVVVY